MSVLQGVDYLSEPAPHLFLRADLEAVETPVCDALLVDLSFFEVTDEVFVDDAPASRAAAARAYWTTGPGSEPMEPFPPADGKIDCPRCGRRIKPRRDGQPVRHKSHDRFQPGDAPWCS